MLLEPTDHHKVPIHCCFLAALPCSALGLLRGISESQVDHGKRENCMNISAQSSHRYCLKEIVTVNIAAVMKISPPHQRILVPMADDTEVKISDKRPTRVHASKHVL